MKNPKYVTVKEALITRIRAGAYSEDDPLFSEAELSVAYHASRNTIRQALKELENEGYIYRARGKGTFIRTCSSVNSQKIALLIYDTAELQSSVTMKMIAGLSETLEEAGFLLDILASHRTFQKENITRLAVNYGGFVIGTSHLDALTIGELGKLAIPHIFVKNYLPHMHDTSVRVDFARAGFLAACHLIDCGCRTLGVVYPGRQIPIASDFFDGVCAAALDQGVQLRKEHIFTTGSYVCDAVTQAAEIPCRRCGPPPRRDCGVRHHGEHAAGSLREKRHSHPGGYPTYRLQRYFPCCENDRAAADHRALAHAGSWPRCGAENHGYDPGNKNRIRRIATGVDPARQHIGERVKLWNSLNLKINF